MHYVADAQTGKDVTDQTSFGVKFAGPDETPDNSVLVNIVSSMLAIRIPANTKGHTLSKVSEFERESKIISFRPHMHLRGKSIKVEFQSSVARSDGTEAEWQTLLSVPRWNFNWQNYYVFKEPIHAPKGSKVRLTATWDNNSDKVIRWGLSNEFEMMMGWMSFIETGE